MPAALSTEKIDPRPPKIHVHVRPKIGGKKTIDKDFHAISLLYSESLGLFGSADITRVNVTPSAAFEFVCGIEANREMICINCSHCGYPHLDLGDFARTPHRKHFCGNCGRDSTWSLDPIVSTPLKPLPDQYAKALKYETSNRVLYLGNYASCSFTVRRPLLRSCGPRLDPRELRNSFTYPRQEDTGRRSSVWWITLEGEVLE